jgi:hypothetical protein
MKAVFARGSLLLLAVALAGCQSSGGPRPVDVTSYHLGQPIARGQIAVETFAVPDAGGPEFRIYAEAVARELMRLGWTLTDTVGQSEQVALVRFEQSSFVDRPGGSPVSVGVGGGTGGWGGGGVGGGVAIDLSGKPHEMVMTTLQVRIKRRSDGTIFWEGRSSGVARPDRPEGQSSAIAARLADALFRDFPGESGRTISVR